MSRLFVEMSDDLKGAIERAVEALVDLLDQMDEADPEESGDDEPPEGPPHLRGANGKAPIRRIY